MPLAITPARLPAMRGLQWFLEAARAVRQKPLLWLPATLLLGALHVALFMLWLITLSMVMDKGFLMMQAVFLSPALMLSVLPLLVVPCSGAAHRHFLPASHKAPLLHRLEHALALALVALLAATLLELCALGLIYLASDSALTSIGTLGCTTACALAVALWVLLAQALATCGVPWRDALARAARAAVHPAFLCHVAILTCAAAAEISVCLAVGRYSTPFKILYYSAPFALMLEMLITPWLMARDMFSTGAE